MNELIEEIKKQLKVEKQLDIEYIKENSDDPIGDLEYLEEEYNLYDSKLEVMSKTKEMDEEEYRKFMTNVIEMKATDSVSIKQRYKMIMSYGVLINYFSTIDDRTTEEVLMLSAVTSGIDVEDYYFYGAILVDPNVASSIVNKSNDFLTQVDIGYDVMDNLNQFDCNYPNAETYDPMVNSSIEVVNNYTESKEK